MRAEHNRDRIGTSDRRRVVSRSCGVGCPLVPVEYLGDRRRGGAAAVASVCPVQLGAGFAATLFDDVSPAAVVVLRQGGAALVLWLWRRPRWRGRAAREWRTIVAFGVVLATMNITFYEAVDRLPLGIAVTVELLGPLGLAVAFVRRASEFLAVGLAAAGVVLLGEGGGGIDPSGLAFASVAAGCWASYILLSRANGRDAGFDRLTLSLTVACVVALRSVRARARRSWGPSVLAIGGSVAVLSALVPFSLDMQALRQLPPRTFGVLQSLSPVAATLSGWLVLGQRLDAVQLVAVALVVVASGWSVVTSG